MTTPDQQVVPAEVMLAAKRAFVRTTAQSYAAAIPAGGIPVAALLRLVENPSWVLIAVLAVAVLFSPPLAGLSAFLDIIWRGIPADYRRARK